MDGDFFMLPISPRYIIGWQNKNVFGIYQREMLGKLRKWQKEIH